MVIAIVLLIVGVALGAGGTLAIMRRRGPTTRPLNGPRNAVSVWKTIAVPIVNGVLPREALVAAARVGKAFDIPVVVLAVLQVPRTVGLNAELAPEVEKALSRAEAAERIVRDLGAHPYSEVLRVREIGDVVERACADIGAGLVVIEPNEASRATMGLVQTFIDSRGHEKFDVLLARTAATRLVDASARP